MKTFYYDQTLQYNSRTRVTNYRLRFNSDNNLLEYYTGSEESIDSPPSITNFSFNAESASTSQFVSATDTHSQNVVITAHCLQQQAQVSVVFKGILK